LPVETTTIHGGGTIDARSTFYRAVLAIDGLPRRDDTDILETYYRNTINLEVVPICVNTDKRSAFLWRGSDFVVSRVARSETPPLSFWVLVGRLAMAEPAAWRTSGGPKGK